MRSPAEKDELLTVAGGVKMTLIALFAAGSSPTLSSPAASDGREKKKPTTAFYLFAALFDSAAYGHSASWFRRYINETNPRCVFFLFVFFKNRWHPKKG